MAIRRTARLLSVVALLIVLGVLLPSFVSIARYRSRVGGALSRALGRDVSIGSVSLRLLPQPGVTMENFVVAEDPRFGAEPMLRANEVVATLRVSSMWRGRFEIASLSLKEPSLNLVRLADGHWNIESLFQRAVQTPTAPTGKSRPESRPRFPYIEASSGRINFKVGEEKKVWALVDADFALWLASEDEWRTRLLARPVRTDESLSDTGLIRVNGSLQRTSRMDTGLLKFRLALEHAQLGQLSTLIYGHDRGWRGATDATVDLSGTLGQLTLSGAASVDQFRRYDITPPDSLRLEARCVAQYTPAQQQLAGIECHLPADNGDLAARGSIRNIFAKPQFDIGVVARDVPMSYAVAFARRAKKDLPTDLTAAGMLDATLTVRSEGDNAVVWDGGGSTRDFTLQSAVLERPLRLGVVQFAMQPDNVPAAGRAARPAVLPVAASYRVSIPPFPLPLGASRPAVVEGGFTHDGYSLNLSGDVAVERLLQVGRAAGMPARAQSVTGGAFVTLQISGPWQGFQQPLVTGVGTIQNARLDLPGVAAPLEISRADVALSADHVDAQAVAFRVGPLAGVGTFRLPRACASNPNCEIQFTARADQVSFDDLNRLLNPRLRTEPWYRRLASAGAPDSWFAHLHASGQVSIARLAAKSVVLQNFAGNLRLDPGALQLSAARASLFGGTVRGDWRADFTGSQPAYAGSGTLQRVALAQLSSAMRDNWATGAADGRYRITLSGWNAADLVKSADAGLDFTWKDGSLRHLALAAPVNRNPARIDTAAALRINTFRGRATLRDGVLTISDSQMETPSGVYAVKGTATSARELSLTFTLNRGQQYNVGGTLAAPRVQAVALPPQRTAVVR